MRMWKHAVAGAAYGIFASGGQSCIAGSRIFVHDAVYDRFVPRLVALARRLRIGPPTDPATEVAPMASFPHRDQVQRQVERARAEGAEVLCGGAPPRMPSLRSGAYFTPTVLAVGDNRMSIAQEEVFGPVASVLRFRDEDDLVQQANDTVFGLACGLWTADYQEGAARRPPHQGRDGLGQHLSAGLDLDAVWRRQGQRPGTREGHRGDARRTWRRRASTSA